MKYLATPSSVFIFISSSSTGELSALIQSETRFVELGEYSQNILSVTFWTPNITSSQFDEYPELYSRNKSSPNQEPTIFAEYSQLCSRTNVRPIIKNGLYERHIQFLSVFAEPIGGGENKIPES